MAQPTKSSVESMQKGGKLLVISGPSAGVGKDTVLQMFKKAHPDWEQPLSTTTRSPRNGETDGVNMNFIDRETFEKKIENGEFLEYFEVTGNLYGTPKQPLEQLLNEGKSVVLRKDYQGALVIKKTMPEAVTVFLVPDDMQILESRIRSRATDSEEDIEERLELAKEELAHKNEFDHVIVNPQGHPEKALSDIEKAAGL